MTSSAAIFGTYFVLFLVVTTVVAQESNESTEVDEGTIATPNATDFDSLNSTTEERPSKCKEILQGFVNESVNSTRPLIEEHVLNATKNLFADEIIPGVTLQIETKVATAVTQEVEGLKELVSGLVQKVTGLEETIALKDTKISQLEQRLNVLETKVIFSAVKSSGGNFKGQITYDNLVVNLGEGFDMGSGTFVVPTSGLYRLTFSAQSAYEKYDYTTVYVKKNGEGVFQIWDSNEEGDGNNLSYTWMQYLNRGDSINLYSSNHLYAGSDNPVNFTGELIHI